MPLRSRMLLRCSRIGDTRQPPVAPPPPVIARLFPVVARMANLSGRFVTWLQETPTKWVLTDTLGVWIIQQVAMRGGEPAPRSSSRRASERCVPVAERSAPSTGRSSSRDDRTRSCPPPLPRTRSPRARPRPDGGGVKTVEEISGVQELVSDHRVTTASSGSLPIPRLSQLCRYVLHIPVGGEPRRRVEIHR